MRFSMFFEKCIRLETACSITFPTGGTELDIRISGRHVEVTDAMRAHARERVQKLERYSPHLMHVAVTLSIEGERHTAEMLASFKGRGDVVAKCETHDMYQAIDQAIGKIEKQLRRLEARVKDRREGSRQRRTVEEPLLEAEQEADEPSDATKEDL